MGNKLGSPSLQGSLQTSKMRNDNGSSESLSTIVSLNSHAESCLLKKSNSYSFDGAKRGPCKGIINRKQHESIADSSTEITSLDDLNFEQEEKFRLNDNQEKGIIPERLLRKLTTEDWNDLVHFICSSMEQSLQSNILKTLEELRERKIDSNSQSGDSSEDGMNKTDSVDARQENQELSSSELDSNRLKTRRRCRTTRPVSMPPDSLLSGEYIIRNHHKHHHHRRARHHHRSDSKSPPIDVSIDDNCPKATVQRRRTSSNPHKVRFVDSRLTRSCSGTSLDELGIKSACRSLEKQNGYLTLDQLKDLGLSLRQDSSKTYEGLSSFSMKCWHGDPDYHLMQNKRRPRRRHSNKRSSANRLSKNKEDTASGQKQQTQFEQLCLLGPSVSPSPSNPDNDRLSPSPSAKDTDSNPDEESGVKVEHLHQHSHHHFHHFIHHSLSQPSDLCAGGTTYPKPAVHYIISESQ